MIEKLLQLAKLTQFVLEKLAQFLKLVQHVLETMGSIGSRILELTCCGT